MISTWLRSTQNGIHEKIPFRYCQEGELFYSSFFHIVLIFFYYIHCWRCVEGEESDVHVVYHIGNRRLSTLTYFHNNNKKLFEICCCWAVVWGVGAGVLCVCHKHIGIQCVSANAKALFCMWC